MQTLFTAQQLEDPAIQTANGILRACVHCGFCTATCPTFVLLGDERDSPRGRIYLIKDMLEKDRAATAEDALHIDRCLSCLACMTTCPSGVHYMHLVDHARAHIAETYKRPLMDRVLREVLARVLPYPGRFKASLRMARLARPFARRILPDLGEVERQGTRADFLARAAAMLSLAPSKLPKPDNAARPQNHAPGGERRARVALLTGCAQSVLAPSINAAAIRLLNRAGVEVVLPKGEGCCGALVHHMGREDASHAAAKANIDAWWHEIENGGLDAIVITASGCGTTVKDYGFMLAQDAAYADKAAKISELTKDITEFLTTLDLGAPQREAAVTIAYHSACSMQHGQQIKREPKALLSAAGFDVKDVPEGHLCCGSAGTYNIMQPAIAARLKSRKLGNLEKTGADLVATGNIGCITQLQSESRPVIHTVELLDWAYGGPTPKGAEQLDAAPTRELADA
ncbi:MAG: heterodisulfide reductase-related iron-sulfur binding cluster [Devosia sp.]